MRLQYSRPDFCNVGRVYHIVASLSSIRPPYSDKTWDALRCPAVMLDLSIAAIEVAMYESTLPDSILNFANRPRDRNV